MKTQAELDAAVVEAAEAWISHMEANHGPVFNETDCDILQWRAVREAVRARREAMRPTKLELLAGAVYGRCSTLTDSEAKRLYRENYSTEGSMLYQDIRNLRARILAACPGAPAS